METLDVEKQKETIEANKAAEAAPIDPMETEEVQIAAGYYEQLRKSIRGYTSVMNGKGIARVLVAVAEFPYADKYPKFKTDAEQKLFTFMLAIQKAKGTIADALRPELGALQGQAVDGIVKEAMEQKTQGDENGSKVD